VKYVIAYFIILLGYTWMYAGASKFLTGIPFYGVVT